MILFGDPGDEQSAPWLDGAMRSAKAEIESTPEQLRREPGVHEWETDSGRSRVLWSRQDGEWFIESCGPSGAWVEGFSYGEVAAEIARLAGLTVPEGA